MTQRKPKETTGHLGPSIITLICLLGALAMALIPLLGIDHATAKEFINSRSAGGGLEAKVYFGGVNTGMINATWIGLLPAFVAMTLMRLLIVIVAPLRRASRAGRLTWVGWAELGLTLPIAFALAWIYCTKFASIQLFTGVPVLPIAHFTATAMALAVIAHVINIKGRGNGFVLIPAAAWFTGLPKLVVILWAMKSAYSPLHYLILLVITAAVVFGTVVLVRKWVQLTREPSHGRDAMGLVLSVLMAAAVFHLLLFLPFISYRGLPTIILSALLPVGTCWLFFASYAGDDARPKTGLRQWALIGGVMILVTVQMILNRQMNIPYHVTTMLVGTGAIVVAGASQLFRTRFNN